MSARLLARIVRRGAQVGQLERVEVAAMVRAVRVESSEICLILLKKDGGSRNGLEARATFGIFATYQ